MTDLTPGPEMDRAVAEAVGIAGGDYVYLENWVPFFGRTDRGERGEEWSPSTDIAHAIEALEATGQSWSMYRFRGEREGLVRPYGTRLSPPEPAGWFPPMTLGHGDTLPEAACRAILAWAEAKTNETNDTP